MKFLLAGAALLLACLLYVLFWPVPIEPVGWNAPADRGLVDPFGPDDRLKALRGFGLGDHEGPEDLAIGPDGYILAGVESGEIVAISASGRVREFAQVGGRPLGLARDVDGALIVANAYLGVQRVEPDGAVSTLLSEIDGSPLVYANNVAVADDGRIFFSEASTKFGAKRYSGTYAASLLDIMEHGGHGRVIEFDRRNGAARVLVDGLQFANGVAISDDNDFLLIAETGQYRVLRHWLSGPEAGRTEVLIDNLPGFPDNISRGMQGRFWIGFAASRNELLDALSSRPWLRKVVQRLPAFVRPRAEPYAHVFAIDGDGTVLMNLQDPDANFPTLTGVLETRDSLYLSTLFGNRLPVMDKRDLL